MFYFVQHCPKVAPVLLFEPLKVYHLQQHVQGFLLLPRVFCVCAKAFQFKLEIVNAFVEIFRAGLFFLFLHFSHDFFNLCVADDPVGVLLSFFVDAESRHSSEHLP